MEFRDYLKLFLHEPSLTGQIARTIFYKENRKIQEDFYDVMDTWIDKSSEKDLHLLIHEYMSSEERQSKTIPKQDDITEMMAQALTKLYDSYNNIKNIIHVNTNTDIFSTQINTNEFEIRERDKNMTKIICPDIQPTCIQCNDNTHNYLIFQQIEVDFLNDKIKVKGYYSCQKCNLIKLMQ